MMSKIQDEKIDWEMPLELDCITDLGNGQCKLVRTALMWSELLGIEMSPAAEIRFAQIPGKKCIVRTTLGPYVINAPYEIVLQHWDSFKEWQKENRKKLQFYLPLQ